MSNFNYTNGDNKPSGKSRKNSKSSNPGDEENKLDLALVEARREKLRLMETDVSFAYFGRRRTEPQDGSAEDEETGKEEVEKKIAKWAMDDDLTFFDNFDSFMERSRVGFYGRLDHRQRLEFFMEIPVLESGTMEAEVEPYNHPFMGEHLKSLKEEGAILAPQNADGSRFLVIHPKYRAIFVRTLKVSIAGAAEVETLVVSDTDFIIKACFDNVRVYHPTIAGQARKIEFYAISGLNSTRIHVGPATDKDALSALEQRGLVMDKTHALDTLRQAIAAYIESGKAEQLTGTDTPGFYKDPQSDGILPVGYSVKEIPLEELKAALMILTRISSKFPRSLNRFSAAVKHSLSAPFSYYLRQRRIYPQHLMFYGITGTSKTALMLINHGIWGLWDPESSNHGFFISGGEADTPSRIGERLEQGTFTVIIDEGEGLFLKSDGRENVPVIGILKHAMQSLVSRQTSDRGTFQALASVAIASNVKPPRGAAPILSRMATYESGSSEQIHASLSDKEKFQKTQNELYPQLSPIGQYVAARAVANPDILTADFEAFGETMLREMYTYAGLEVPEWVNIHAEPTSVEDLDRDIREEIRIFGYKSNLEAYSRNIGRTGVLKKGSNGSEYPEYDDRTNVSAEQKIRTSIESGLLSWQIFKDTKGVEQVILTTGFAKEISKIVGEAYNLQSIGELLSFECKYVRIGNSTPWTIVAGLEEYLKFLIPEIDEVSHDEAKQIRGEMRSFKSGGEAPGVTTTLDEKKEKIERPWKTREESGDVALTGESKDKKDTESHEDPSETGKGENATDPVLKHLIDCTYNSSKKFKTVHELFGERPPGCYWSESFIYQHLEEWASRGTVIRKGTGYAFRDLVEGNS